MVCRHPGADDEAGEVLKAIVVARGPLREDEMIAFVDPRMTRYKRIRVVEFVDQIPKSPSGTILRRVLVARERAGHVSSSWSEHPASLQNPGMQQHAASAVTVVSAAVVRNRPRGRHR